MQQTLLITGHNMEFVYTVIEHIPVDFYITYCPLSPLRISKAIKRLNARVLVICLDFETAETMEIYRTMRDWELFSQLKLIVIGKSDDCKRFEEQIGFCNATMFSRPLKVERFLAELDNYITTNREQAIFNEEEAWLNDFVPENDEDRLRLKMDVVSAQAREDARREMNQGTVLVIDDDPKMLATIKKYLEDLFSVVLVPNGKLAKKYLEQNHADLILLDYVLKFEDGPTLYRYFKMDDNTRGIPIVFLTGVTDKDKVLNIIKLQPQGYLIKPVKRAELIARIIETMGSAKEKDDEE